MKKYLYFFILFALFIPAGVYADSNNLNSTSLKSSSTVPVNADNSNAASPSTINNINLPSVNRTLVFSGYTLSLPDIFKHTFDSGLSVFLKGTGSSSYPLTGLAQMTSNVPFAPATTTINKAIPNAALIGIGYKVNQNVEVQLIPISIGLFQKDGNVPNNGNSSGTLFGFIYNF